MAKSHSDKTIKGLMLKSLIWIFLLPAVVIWISFFISSADTIKKNAINEQMTVTNTLNLSLEKEVLEMENSMDKLMGSSVVLNIMQGEDLNARDSKRYNAYDSLNKIVTRTMNKPDNVILINMTGGMYSYNAIRNADKEYLLSEEFYNRVLGNKGEPVIVTGLERPGGEKYFLVVKPIMDITELKLLGIMGISAPPKLLADLSGRQSMHSDSITFVDEQGAVLYSNSDLDRHRDILEKDIEKLVAGGSGELVQERGNDIYVSSKKNSYGIRTLNFISVSQINKELVTRQLAIMLVALVVMALVTLLLFYVYKKIYANIRRINAQKTGSQGVEYYELKQIDQQISSLITTKEQGEEKIVKLVNRCETITLDKLQAQINPHFLYNTLSSIKYMALLEGQEKISSMITALVRLLRSAINRGGSFIALGEELLNIESYMLIQNTIYNNNIDFEIAVPKELKERSIPNFVLQPLLENCIFHGIHPEESGGHIRISAQAEGERLIIDVEDNGEGFDEEFMLNLLTAGSNNEDKQGFTNLGIKGVQDKIRLLCGEDYGLTMKSEKGGGSRVRICLPLKEGIKLD